MIRTLPLALPQATADHIETIASAQVVMAAVMVLFGLIALGAAIGAFLALRSVRRTIGEVQQKMQPVIDNASKISGDVAQMTENVRGEVNRIRETLDDVNYRIRKTADAVEDRVERFGEVLRVVQEEAEELLMTAAATARGFNAAAGAMREPGERGRRPRPRRPIEEDEEDEDDFE